MNLMHSSHLVLLKNRQIFFLVMLGTLVRWGYAAYIHPWMETPDQLAWQLSLDEMLDSGKFLYKKLMYYPHEGGGALIGLLAICLKPLAYGLPPLSLAALVIDAAARFAEIKLAQKLFGNQTAFWYSLWSLLMLPILFVWSGINFCPHYLTSVLPFIFLYAVSSRSGTVPNALRCGLLAGLFISFSYNGIIFIPAFVSYVLLRSPKEQRSRIILSFLAFVTLGLLPHLFLRIVPDNGFHLENLSLGDVREFTVSDVISFKRLINLVLVFVKPLSSSFFLAAGGKLFSIPERITALLFLGVGFFLVLKHRQQKDSKVLLGWLLTGFFLAIYALSPFYSNEGGASWYYHYRHLTYILPLLMLLLTDAYLKAGKKVQWVFPMWLGLCSISVLVYISLSKPVTNASYRAEGWIVARKFGEDPRLLMDLYHEAPACQRADLNFGFGWGTAAALLRTKTAGDTTCIYQLEKLYYQYPPANRKLVYDGIRFAFGPGITPELDKKLLEAFNKKLEINLQSD